MIPSIFQPTSNGWTQGRYYSPRAVSISCCAIIVEKLVGLQLWELAITLTESRTLTGHIYPEIGQFVVSKVRLFWQKRQTEQHFSLFGQKKLAKIWEKRQTDQRQTDQFKSKLHFISSKVYKLTWSSSNLVVRNTKYFTFGIINYG